MEYPEYKDLNNYRFYRNGKVVNLANGHILTQRKIKGGHYINISTKNSEGYVKNQRICVERKLYELFTGDSLTRLYSIVKSKNNDSPDEYDINDLIKVSKKDKYKYDPNAECGKKLDEETVTTIRSEYNFDHKARCQYDKKGPSIRELAARYGVTINTIQRVLKGTY